MEAECVCFVVRAGDRKQGLMHDLLDGTVAHANVISGYVGTTALFEAHGFERAAETTGKSGGRPRVVMRREL